jgi:antitoxin component HigA of HigAB toxin-antitoxin module
MEHGLMPFQHVHVRNMEKEAFEKKYFTLFIPHAIEVVIGAGT